MAANDARQLGFELHNQSVTYSLIAYYTFTMLRLYDRPLYACKMTRFGGVLRHSCPLMDSANRPDLPINPPSNAVRRNNRGDDQDTFVGTIWQAWRGVLACFGDSEKYLKHRQANSNRSGRRGPEYDTAVRKYTRWAFQNVLDRPHQTSPSPSTDPAESVVRKVVR